YLFCRTEKRLMRPFGTPLYGPDGAQISAASLRFPRRCGTANLQLWKPRHRSHVFCGLLPALGLEERQDPPRLANYRAHEFGTLPGSSSWQAARVLGTLGRAESRRNMTNEYITEQECFSQVLVGRTRPA